LISASNSPPYPDLEVVAALGISQRTDAVGVPYSTRVAGMEEALDNRIYVVPRVSGSSAVHDSLSLGPVIAHVAPGNKRHALLRRQLLGLRAHRAGGDEVGASIGQPRGEQSGLVLRGGNGRQAGNPVGGLLDLDEGELLTVAGLFK